MHALYLDYGAYRVKSSSLPRCTSEFVVSNQTQQKKQYSTVIGETKIYFTMYTSSANH